MHAEPEPPKSTETSQPETKPSMAKCAKPEPRKSTETSNRTSKPSMPEHDDASNPGTVPDQSNPDPDPTLESYDPKACHRF